MTEISSGRLRDRIKIWSLEQQRNAQGGYDTTPQLVWDGYAEVIGLDGREAMLDRALQGIASYRITMRWRPGIAPAQQIELPGGTMLNIKSAADPTGRRQRLVLLADTDGVRRV